MLYRIGGILLAIAFSFYFMSLLLMGTINKNKYHDSCDKACIARGYPEGVVRSHLDFDVTCLCQGLLTLDEETGAWK